MAEFRSLNNTSIADITAAFNAAFSDYFIPFQLTEESFAARQLRDGIDLSRSYAMFEGDKAVSFILQAVRPWNNKLTAYNSGTGTIPTHRKKGYAESIYTQIFPILKQQGVEQCLLEVFVQNERAQKLYKKLGFEVTRQMDCLLYNSDEKPEKPVYIDTNAYKDFTIQQRFVKEQHEWEQGQQLWGAEEVANYYFLLKNHWPELTACWDVQPCWAATEASFNGSYGVFSYSILSISKEGRIVSYILYNNGNGAIVQMATHPNYRKRGYATALLNQLKKQQQKIMLYNADTAAKPLLDMLSRHGFMPYISQYEMVKPLQ